MEAKQRRFTIADGMVLLASTALGLAVARVIFHSQQAFFARNMARATVFRPLYYQLEPWRDGTNCLVLAWSMALVVLRLLPPGPSFRRLIRMPGMVACSSAIFSLLFETAVRLPSYIQSWGQFNHGQQAHFLALPHLRGHAVALAWAIQALYRRWRPEPDWIDRAGRAVGLFWIIATLANNWIQILLRR